MKITYTITSSAETEFAVAAQVAGRNVEAKILGLVVEAVSDDGAMGHSFRLADINDMDAAKAEFAVGNILTIDLAAAPAA